MYKNKSLIYHVMVHGRHNLIRFVNNSVYLDSNDNLFHLSNDVQIDIDGGQLMARLRKLSSK